MENFEGGSEAFDGKVVVLRYQSSQQVGLYLVNLVLEYFMMHSPDIS